MEYLEKIKTMSLKRKKENLVLILVLLVGLLICMNVIFKNDEENKVTEEKIEEQREKQSSIEEKICEVLSQIAGVSDVSLVINYVDNGENEIVDDTKEEYLENGTVSSMQRSVAYNEENGDKTAIISIKNSPKVEGVIVVAKGVENIELKQKIASSLANLLGIASYKVQVFEK